MDQVLNQDKYSLRYKISGIVLIEILIVISILAATTAYFLKNQKQKKGINVFQFIDLVNDNLKNTLSEALLNKKKYIFNFNFDSEKKLTNISFFPESNPNHIKIFNINNNFIVDKFIINGKDEFKGNTEKAWIFIYPEGYTQEVEVSFIDEYGIENFILNPFTCRFQRLDNENKT